MEWFEKLWLNLQSKIVEITKGLLPADLFSQVEAQLWLLTSITAILIFAPVTMMYLTWLERKVVARMQKRYGPNRVGPFALLQPLADGIKMFTKEDIVPRKADPILHVLAPVLIVVPALLLFSVMAFGKDMVLVNMNVAVIFIMAVSSIETIAILMAGWGSFNRYSLLGALRAAAQVVSYEIPLGFSLVGVLMMSGSMGMMDIVNAQIQQGWFILTPWGLLGFFIFFLSGVAEVNRSPFDVPEAESELIAGFHTEYSGMKFALFYMAEFLGAFAVCAFAATFFFGGWHGSAFLPSWLWLMLKTYCLMFIMLWFRGTLPRLRVDQLLNLAWKYLLPMSLVNVVIVTIYYHSPWYIGWPVGLIMIFGAHQALTAHKINKLHDSYNKPKPEAIIT